jgi:hypothetical protein
VEVEGPEGLLVGAQAGATGCVVHLVNGVGERPLPDAVPLPEVIVRLPMATGKQATAVSLHQPDGIEVMTTEGVPAVAVAVPDAWEAICFRWPG